MIDNDSVVHGFELFSKKMKGLWRQIIGFECIAIAIQCMDVTE